MLKFVEHFFWIAAAVDPIGDHPDELWDDEDGFFYDVLRRPDGTGERLEGALARRPAAALRDDRALEPSVLERHPELIRRIREYLERNRDLLTTVADPSSAASNGRRLLALVNEDKLRRILTRVLDEERFYGPHGIRSLSRWHLEHPYRLDVEGVEYEVSLRAGRVDDGHVRRQLQLAGPGLVADQPARHAGPPQHYRYYGDDFTIECPTGSGVR